MTEVSGGLVAYSIQGADVDPARVAAILTRQVPSAVRKWQNRQGISTAVRPVRWPENPDLGMAARVCVPIGRGGS
jgi:hypothetical protein